jgi:hypothetical protein
LPDGPSAVQPDPIVERQEILMSRPCRKPAPPGRVKVVCSHRSDRADTTDCRRIKVMQMLADSESPGGIMITALGGPRVEGFAYSFRCPDCHRHWKIAKERFPQVVVALAEMQGTHGDTPVIIDISRLDRAL